MDAIETAAWQTFTRRNQGRWVVDQIHNAPDDFLAYRPSRSDPTFGYYIMIVGRTAYVGTFHDANPHIGDAIFKARWSASFPAGAAEAFQFVVQRIGVQFLIDITNPA